MQSITCMNNNAALLIEQKKYNVALEILAEALGNVQHEVDCLADPLEHVVEHAGHHNPQEQVGNTRANAYVYSFLDSQRVQERREAAMQCDPLDQHHASCSAAQQSCMRLLDQEEERAQDFVYRHPIHANPDLANDTENGVYILSVIIVFNLGLTHHLMALDDSPMQRTGKQQKEVDDDGEDTSQKHRRRYLRHLKSALRLYELGFHMQMKGCVSMDMTYAMAMVNNCACIYEALNKKRRAIKFYQHLLSSLLFLVENGEAENIDELDGFLSNASRLILRKNVVAAAA